MIKLLSSIFLVTLFLTLGCGKIYAAGEFSTSYDINYSVSESGETVVTEKISLKNLTDKFFPSSFSVTLPGTEISEIEAFDNQGALQTQISPEGTTTKVTVSFSNQQVIGLNKEYPWTLRFKDKSITRALGKVWSVNIPKISQQAEVENLLLTLSVPTTFDDPNFISPKPSGTTESGGKINISFTKNELLNSGISAIFGDSLSFEFENSFILKNNSIFPKFFSLVIPGNSAYQKSYIEKIEPLPENVVNDELGNTIAVFKTNANQEYEVKVKGNLKTYLNPLKKVILTEKERTSYTKETKFWESQNPNIRTKLLEILTEKPGGTGDPPPENMSTLEKASLIDKYVSNFLQFDQSRLERSDFVRFGSITALNNPGKALGAEYVDLESALLRASNIPTRQVIGFALKGGSNKPFSFSNQNLHTWLEFYDDSLGWVTADPAWESTTRGADFFSFNDLNHLALAYSNGNDKFVLPGSVETKIYEPELYEEKGAQLDVDVKDEILSGFPATAKITVTNLGNSEFPATTLDINTSKILLELPDSVPVTSKSIQTPAIPPFGHLEYTFNLKTGAIWHSYQDAFQVRLSGIDDTRIITVVPILSYKIFAVELIGGLILIILFYILILLLHHKSAKRNG